MASITLVAFFGSISRSCRLARVVTCAYGPQNFSAMSAIPANCQCLRMPFGMRSRHM